MLKIINLQQLEDIGRGGFSFRSFRWVLALLFAIGEVNESPGALPNLTLGVAVLDTCSNANEALRGAAYLLSGHHGGPLTHQCWGGHPRLAAVLGDSGAESALSVAKVIGIYKYPQISYFTPPLEFGDRVLFPSSLSVAPALFFQAKGLARLLQVFGWSWVGVLSQAGSASTVAQTFLEEIEAMGICLAFWEDVPSSPKDISRVASVIRRSTANVVVVFSLEAYLNPVLVDLAFNGDGRARVWLSTEAWSTSPRLVTPWLSRFLQGSLGVVLRNGAAPGFKEFVFGLHPSKTPKNPFIREFWEEAFRCQWVTESDPSLPFNLSLKVSKPSSISTSTSVSLHSNTSSVLSSNSHSPTSTPSSFSSSTLPFNNSHTIPFCTGLEEPASLQIFSDIDDLRVTYNVYKAVKMVAKTLKDMATCKSTDGLLDGASCIDMQHFKPWQFLYYLRRVRLKGNVDEELYFDSLGNAPAVYDIISWQEEPSGVTSWVRVGSYETGALHGQDLLINHSALLWWSRKDKPPVSVCSENCPPGFWKARREGQPHCCFDCIPCAAGKISNQTDSVDCFPCADHEWPNYIHDQCLPRAVELLSFSEPLGISLGTTSIISSILPAAVLLLFIRNRDTPLVRANNRALSFILLAGLTLCFLCPLLLLLPPGNQTCLLRQAAFGVLFTLCISCLLSKTLIVVLAFRANHPGGCVRVLMGPRWPILIALSCTFLQFILCFSWINITPPFPEQDNKSLMGKIIIQCDDGVGFWFMLGYLGVLSTICFLVAFLARKLPGAFNEATHITFSMLVFLSVWVSFVPAYLSAKGKLSVATEIFAILSSSAGLLFCIFSPKCYIILLRPHLNTRALVSGQQRRQPANHQRVSPPQWRKNLRS
ncbi:extracellular calcium-sensing receptor-like [Spea bombifrons]|uniref:extracellular calcium-sensing receptor-like n=1 Tax=Spea bombifrons TaxID=233779 RepID=UPI00234A97B4|nr:extracellular calcium-sensing receptor-like [Spea bombifrons]